MADARVYQERFLQEVARRKPDRPLSAAVRAAFLETPRHRFVQRYRSDPSTWHDVDENNEPQLAVLYENRPLVLAADGDKVVSTISQPSLVLDMIDRLRLEPGHSVFELGTASGWNAALMAHVVGPTGSVTSVEILPELAESAAQLMRELGRDNVRVIHGDGGDGFAAAAPYDRAIFTAGTHDLPRAFYDQLKDGGLLLVVLKLKGGGDTLFLLRKVGDHFESIEASPCGFVPLTGKYALDGMDPIAIADVPEWSSLTRSVSQRRRFWWGLGGIPSAFQGKTFGFRGFLGIVEPALLGVFKRDDQHLLGFGLWTDDRRGLTIATDDDAITTYGAGDSAERFQRRLDEWFALGMPDLSRFRLHAYPIDVMPANAPSTLVTRLRESAFYWILDA